MDGLGTSPNQDQGVNTDLVLNCLLPNADIKLEKSCYFENSSQEDAGVFTPDLNDIKKEYPEVSDCQDFIPRKRKPVNKAPSEFCRNVLTPLFG